MHSSSMLTQKKKKKTLLVELDIYRRAKNKHDPTVQLWLVNGLDGYSKIMTMEEIDTVIMLVLLV